MERVSSGVEGLDNMLRGGYIPGRPYIITGPSGSGKSILGTQFLLDGLRHGEQCMLVALDEPPSEIKSNMATFGWNLDQLTTLDATPDIKSHKKKNVIDVGTTLDVRGMDQVKDVRKSMQIRTMEVTIHSVQKMIKQSARDLRERITGGHYSRVVIDSMTALKRFSLKGEDARVLVQSFLRFLSELNATTVIISNPMDPTTLETEFLLARGELLVHKWIDGNAVRRAISVEWFRGSGFDDRLRPMTIGRQGVTVFPNASITAKGALSSAIDRPFLESRVAAEVNERLDEVLQSIDAVRTQGGETQMAEGAVLRGLVAMHRKRYEEAIRHLITAKSKLAEELRMYDIARRAEAKRT
ncbi:MAG TPA: ATPase domain-containing protein [Thermoplasmata archaeon]|jgi:KaiC/GvpD/RAD55 family RecA-like ATPase|nr:ATPase domain-containing protein [Thermoplasmata archaeon]